MKIRVFEKSLVLILSLSVLLPYVLCSCKSETHTIQSIEDREVTETSASSADADPEWESKIIAGVFDSEIYENGKYLVVVFLSDPPRGTDCKSRNDAFLKRYGIEAKDVKYIGDYTATVIIYATRELIEEIAKDRDTVLIDSFVNERPVNM